MIDDLLSRLDKVRRITDGHYVACCPAHPDKSPSLSINHQGDMILFHCHAGCYPEEILKSVGLEWKDLYPEDAEFHRAAGKRLKLEPVDPLRVDENILLIAQNKLEAGEPLSAEDEARVNIAYERVTESRNG